MKKISTLITAIAGIFGFIFLFSFSANAQEEEQGIKLSRFIVPALITPGSTVTVNIFIDKSYRGGVARLDEFLPSGFSAIETDDNGARFYIVSDTAIHFAWESMPSDPGFTVSYRLKVPATAMGNYTLTADFIYVTSAGAVAAYFKPYTITVQNAPETPVAVAPAPAAALVKDSIAASTPIVTQTSPAQVAQPVPVAKVDSTPIAKPVEVKATPVVIASKPKAVAKPAPKAPVVKTPVVAAKPDTTKLNGLWYRVQIMASAQRLEVDSVIINGIRDKLYIITKNGISRYYIGAFHTLQPALDYRNRIMGNGLKGPFVVAYKDGQKITIKEALQVVATN